MGRTKKSFRRTPKKWKTKAVRYAKKIQKVKVERKKREVSSIKLDEVAKLQQELGKYPTIAIIDMTGLPSSNLQAIQSKVGNKAKLIFKKRNVVTRALEANPKIKVLSEKLGQNSALLLSNLNAFELFALLKKNMSDAPAKPGQIAPFDLIVKAGPTPFTPGPVLTELSAVGIKAGVEAGKVSVKQDSIVVKSGQPVSDKASSILMRLGLKPMKIGLSMALAWENGEIYTREALDVDTDKLIQQIKDCYMNACKLSIGTGLLTEETIKYLLKKAQAEALTLSKKIGGNTQ